MRRCFLARVLPNSWPGLFLILSLALALFSLAGCRKGAEEASGSGSVPQGSLSGSVLAAKGPTPRILPRLVGARVTLEPGGFSAVVGEKGRYLLEGIPAGSYRLSAQAEGFQSHTLPLPVAIPAGGAASADVFLFALPGGPPQAGLAIASRGEGFPYNTEVELDASASENTVREGMRWEITDASGRLLQDPLNPGKPLQLNNSSLPGSSPYHFVFTPPAPGRYSVKLILTNGQAPGQPSSAEAPVVAVNVPPEAVASVLAGPLPPQQEPQATPRSSSGLKIIAAGETVYLRGWGVDANAPSPELYNPGVKTNLYGKNQDQLQRQFGWRWSLEFNPAGGTGWRDLTPSLSDPAGQYASFRAVEAGRYRATLVVADGDPSGGLTSPPASVEVLALKDGTVEESSCAGCHEQRVASWQQTTHARPGRGGSEPAAACQQCHGPAGAHLAASDPAAKSATQDVTLRAEGCGRCHQEYAEWEKSRHSDGYAYGYLEIAPPLLLNCARCHYPGGYAEVLAKASQEGKPFREVQFKKPAFPGGPAVAFDFSKLPPKDGEGVTCQACHDPHPASGAAFALRAGTPGASCNTCHEDKWQNAVLEGKAGEIQNGYEYPGRNYNWTNPHRTDQKCVLCHMARSPLSPGDSGIRPVGGHTMRMRDAGPDGVLGGYGTLPDGSGDKNPGERDDLLNLAPCQGCHADLKDFNYRGTQQLIYKKWLRLGELLRERNEGTLPGFKPGDKCATCHRGGTLPFDNDPKLVLEQAYTNYKLVKNDRSWGIHNPQYVEKMLDDSIASVQKEYKSPGKK